MWRFYSAGCYGVVAMYHPYINLYRKLDDDDFNHIFNYLYNANPILSVKFLRISEELVCFEEFRVYFLPASLNLSKVAVLV